METLATIHELRAWRRRRPKKVALVPTMGALHEGHLAHLDLALRHADDVVVSVFVNPTQFGPSEDFDRYPRDLERDMRACAARGATAVFCPSVEEMYPSALPEASVDVPPISRELEGTHRPGHFPGVCRVVAKLLMMAMPDAATFGRKDFQQLRVVQAMIADLRMDVEVLEAPTVRESDGLAMSSRNRYLSEEGRQRARGISQSLQACRELLADKKQATVAELETLLRERMAAHKLDIDYAVVRDAAWLEAVPEVSADGPPAVAVSTCRVEGTRLLDNLLLNRPDPSYRVGDGKAATPTP